MGGLPWPRVGRVGMKDRSEGWEVTPMISPPARGTAIKYPDSTVNPTLAGWAFNDEHRLRPLAPSDDARRQWRGPIFSPGGTPMVRSLATALARPSPFPRSTRTTRN